MYFLPDYQGNNFSGSRKNERSGPQASTQSCSDYSNYYSAMQRGMDCDSNLRTPAPGLSCYYCKSCGPEYKYDDSNCSSDGGMLTGEQCGGKYNQCICDRSRYPYEYRGADENCYQQGKDVIICHISGSSEGYYGCTGNICDSFISESDCRNEGMYCGRTTLNADACPGRCDTCVDTSCDLAENLDKPLESSCENGCDERGNVSGCPEKCAGGCQSCMVCDNEYVLNVELPDYVITEVCYDCSGVIKYKPIGCIKGYVSVVDYWCDPDNQKASVTDCQTLGYTVFEGTEGCEPGTTTVVSCPYDPRYIACWAI